MDVLALVGDYGSKALQHEVVQFGVAFTLAAYVHAKQVRKEMALQMGSISTSIDNLGSTLRADLKVQSDRLLSIENRVEKLETKEKK